MSTFLDIGNLWETNSGELNQMFVGACLVAAGTIVNEKDDVANHANRLAWAKEVFDGDGSALKVKAQAMLRYALATNADFRAESVKASAQKTPGTLDTLIDYLVAAQLDILLK